MDYAQTAKDANYGGQLGAIAGVPSTAPDVSPFIVMNNAALNASDLCSRIRHLADRLAGSAPTTIAGGGVNQKESPNQPPFLHGLRMQADELAANVADASRALDRIERMLP